MPDGQFWIACYHLRSMEYKKRAKNRFFNLAAVLLSFSLAGCAGPSLTSAYPPRITGGAENSGISASNRSHGRQQVKRYLEQVHRQLHRAWSVDVLQPLSSTLPRTDPFNDPTLAVVLELALDRRSDPGWVRVVNGSGHPPFDAAAIRVISSLRRLPPLPSMLEEGHLFLRWTFYRDHRRCSSDHADLLVVQLTRAEEVSRALKRSDYPATARLLKESKERAGLLAEVVRAGLSDPDPARGLRVLPLAYDTMLEAICREHGDSPLGRGALAELVDRGANGPLLRLLAGLSSSAAGANLDRSWALLLLKALSRQEVKPGAGTLAPLLGSSDPGVVFAAAPLVTDPAQLDQILPRWGSRPAVAGPLLVRRCWLRDDGACAEQIGRSLSGPGRRSTLRGLRGYPVPAALEHVAALVRHEEDPRVRLEGIKTLAAYQGEAPLGPLFTALTARENPRVVTAAAQVIGELGRRPLASSYRLAEVGYSQRRGPVAGAVLAAMARLGHETFREDVLRLQRGLEPRHRVLVIGNLWGFGGAVRPYLQRLASGQDAALASAARLSLGELDGVISAPLPPASPAPSHGARAANLDDIISMALSYRYSSKK